MEMNHDVGMRTMIRICEFSVFVRNVLNIY